jgi:hypothetical protein
MNNEKLTLDNFHRASFFPRTWFKLRHRFSEWLHQYRFPLGKIIGLVLVVLMVLSLVYIVKANEIKIPVRKPYPHSVAKASAMQRNWPSSRPDHLKMSISGSILMRKPLISR